MNLGHFPLPSANGALAVFAAGAVSYVASFAPSNWIDAVPTGYTSKSSYSATPTRSATIPENSLPGEGLQKPGATDNSPAAKNLQKKVALMEEGRQFLKKQGTYTAELSKQEVVGDELLDEHVMDLKCREEPFSVYLNWKSGDRGREVLYVEGENEGRLLAHDGGWKSRLPAFSLDPECSLAMRDSRYPVTSAGLGGLVDIMCSVHEHDLKAGNVLSCEHRKDTEFDGRPVHTFITTYRDQKSSPTYRKSITLIDQEWNVPVSTHNFTWPDEDQKSLSGKQLDEATLIESYQFRDINFGTQLTEADFSRDHEDYRFR